MIFQGIRTSFAKKPYIFVIFQGGLDPLSPTPSGSVHVKVNVFYDTTLISAEHKAANDVVVVIRIYT